MTKNKLSDRPVDFSVMKVRFRKPDDDDFDAAVRIAADLDNPDKGEMARLKTVLQNAFSGNTLLRNVWIRHFTLTNVGRMNPLRAFSDDVGLDPRELTVYAWDEQDQSAEATLEQFRSGMELVWALRTTTFPFDYGQPFRTLGASLALRALGERITILERRPSVRCSWNGMFLRAAALDKTLAEHGLLMTDNRVSMKFGVPLWLFRYWNAEDRLRELAPAGIRRALHGRPTLGELTSDMLGGFIRGSESVPSWALLRACTEMGIEGTLAEIAGAIREERGCGEFIRALLRKANIHLAAGFEDAKALYASDAVFGRSTPRCEPAEGVIELRCDPAESLFGNEAA